MSDENYENETALAAPLSGLRDEIDIQIFTARRFPRNLTRFKQQALQMATYDQDTAASCFYALPRKSEDGTKIIEGPGIRLAEIVASTWGNLRFGSRIIAEDDQFIVAQGMAHDLETNVATTLEVRRRITNKSGKKYSADMIAVTANAASAIAVRNAIFKIIPKTYIDQIFQTAKKVAVGEASTLSSRRATVIERLNKMGATKETILNFLGRTGVEEIGLEDLEKLIGIGTAIKEGSISVDEAFNVAQKVPDMTPKSRSEMNGQPSPSEAAPSPAPIPVVQETKPDYNSKISSASIKQILEALSGSGIGSAKFNEYIKQTLNAKTINELTEGEVQGVLQWISKQSSMKS